MSHVLSVPTGKTTYTVANLPGFSGVPTLAVNVSGMVVGSRQNALGGLTPVLYDGATVRSIGPDSTDYVTPQAITNGGQVRGTVFHPATFTYDAFFWDAQHGFVLLPNPSGDATYVSANAINELGEIVGVYGGGPSGWGGFRWSFGAGMTTIPNFSPQAINRFGQVAGVYASDPSAAYAALNKDGLVTQIGPLGSAASFLNDEGDVLGFGFMPQSQQVVFLLRVGVYSDLYGYRYQFNYTQPIGLSMDGVAAANGYGFNNTTHALVMRNGAVVDLNTVSPGLMNTSNAAIDGFGRVVGYAQPGDVPSQMFGFTWSAGDGFDDLNTLLVNPPAGMRVLQALSISDGGHIVASTNVGYVLLRPVLPAPPNMAAAIGPIVTNDPVAAGTVVTASATFTDADTADTHGAVWTWDSAGFSTATVTESNGRGTVSGSHVFARAGIYRVIVTVTDSAGNYSSAQRDVVVYDPSAGFVTGNGWIMSPPQAYKANPSLAGKATFSFVSRYKKGANVPDGNTEFNFQAGGFYFSSTAYDWLVVGGARAQYKGVGKLNGAPGYKFLLTAVDAALLGGGGPDRFRLKVWHSDAASQADVTDYDNQIDLTLAGGSNEGTAIGGGDIVVHAK